MVTESAEFIRDYIPGFIGGKEIADKATDKEIEFLAARQDEANRLHNKWQEIKSQIINLQKAIEAR